MRQVDNVVEMLSERRAGSKLKHISIAHREDSSLVSTIRFVFEGDENEERVIIVWGKDLNVGFGRQEIKNG